MARQSKYTEFRVNCVGDTLAGRFSATSKTNAARGFVKALRVRDGHTVQVWTAEEFSAGGEPETFWVEHLR